MGMKLSLTFPSRSMRTAYLPIPITDNGTAKQRRWTEKLERTQAICGEKYSRHATTGKARVQEAQAGHSKGRWGDCRHSTLGRKVWRQTEKDAYVWFSGSMV